MNERVYLFSILLDLAVLTGSDLWQDMVSSSNPDGS